MRTLEKCILRQKTLLKAVTEGVYESADPPSGKSASVNKTTQLTVLM